MQYVSNGLRRAALVGAVALATVMPAYAQNLNLREGLYESESKVGRKESCTLTRHENDPRIEWRSCESEENGIFIYRTVRNGQLKGVFHHFPDGTMKDFYIVSPELYRLLEESAKTPQDMSRYIIEGTPRYAAELKRAVEIAGRTIKPENDVLANSEKRIEELKEEMRKSEETRKRDNEFWEMLKKLMETKPPIKK